MHDRKLVRFCVTESATHCVTVLTCAIHKSDKNHILKWTFAKFFQNRVFSTAPKYTFQISSSLTPRAIKLRNEMAVGAFPKSRRTKTALQRLVRALCCRATPYASDVYAVCMSRAQPNGHKSGKVAGPQRPSGNLIPEDLLYRWAPGNQARTRTEPAPSELLKATGMLPYDAKSRTRRPHI
ncbi:hypothetical protein SAMN04488092_105207 [Thalassovita taeanensis]|uniref:Uncharacterized protein n=1 Tax=Thalassovita taeanensis TaxID=657014 RepID=A0A1H9EXG1_9RHOB|nr:hypothetical protein SAMN04488092_105207 [Thalassovita taeanensis]